MQQILPEISPSHHSLYNVNHISPPCPRNLHQHDVMILKAMKDLVGPCSDQCISMWRLESPRVQSPLLAQWSQIMLQDTVWFMAAPAHSHRGLDTDNYWGSPGIVCVVLNPLRSKVNGILLPWLLHPTKAWGQDSHCPRGTKVAVTTKHSFDP